MQRDQGGRTFDWLVFFFFLVNRRRKIGLVLRASGNARQRMKINSRSDRVTFPDKKSGNVALSAFAYGPYQFMIFHALPIDRNDAQRIYIFARRPPAFHGPVFFLVRSIKNRPACRRVSLREDVARRLVVAERQHRRGSAPFISRTRFAKLSRS